MHHVSNILPWLLLGVSFSVGPHECMHDAAPPRPRIAVEQPTERKPPPPDVDRVVRMTLTMDDLVTLLRWHAFTEVNAERDEDDLVLSLKHALADLRRANGLDLTPDDSVLAEDAN